MTLGPRLRPLALTAHVVSSVGWLGAVAAFLVLTVIGLTGPDELAVRSAYVAAERVTRLLIVPACLATLVTGLVQALGTTWGLFRHWWVVVKLLLTLVATGLLLLHIGAIERAAEVAAEAASSPGAHRALRVQLVVDAAAAILLLLATTTLSVYKPRGLTRYGWRKQREGS